MSIWIVPWVTILVGTYCIQRGQVASKLDFSALKVKSESPSMGHPITGLTHRLTDSHRDWGWVLLAVYAPVKGASMDAGLELREERAHKSHDRAEGPLQDTERSAPYKTQTEPEDQPSPSSSVTRQASGASVSSCLSFLPWKVRETLKTL